MLKKLHETKSSKFYRKSLTLIAAILQGVNDGLTQAEIAEIQNSSKSLISYHSKKITQIGYLNEIGRDAFKILEITQLGKNFLDQYCSSQNPNQNQFRLENIRFKAMIIKMPIYPIDWRKVQLNNWTQYTSQFDEVKVRLNVGKNPTIEFVPSPIEGSEPYSLRDKELNACKAAAKRVEEDLGIEIGELEISSRPEYVVYSLIAREISKNVGQIDVKGIGKVNASRPHRCGEFEFQDPRTALEFISIVDRVRILESRVSQLELERDSHYTSQVEVA